MPRCQIQAVKGLTIKEIKSSVSSYVSSLRYMKKIIPLTIYNIVYNRVHLDESLFVDNSVCNISFKTFKSKIKNHIVCDLFYWCKGVTEAIEKSCLKEMHLLFQDKLQNVILEDYKYIFSYDKEPNSENLPKSEDVINTTNQLFQSIQSLNEYKKMDEDIDISIEMIFFDNVVSEGYDPPYFIHPTCEPLSLQNSRKLDYNTIGHLKTGYHTLKCYVKARAFGIDSKANSEIVDDINEDLNDAENINKDLNEGKSIDDNENETIEVNLIEDEDMSLDITNGNRDKDPDEIISLNSNSINEGQIVVSDENNFHCPCEANTIIEETENIKCSICAKYQHLCCIGCTRLVSVNKLYICVYCNSTNNNSFDTYLLNRKRENWKLICGLRLVLFYCNNGYHKFPIHLMEKFDKDVRKDLLNLIKDRKLMKVHPRNGSFKLIKDSVDAIMSELFSDFVVPYSMVLD